MTKYVVQASTEERFYFVEADSEEEARNIAIGKWSDESPELVRFFVEEDPDVHVCNWCGEKTTEENFVTDSHNRYFHDVCLRRFTEYEKGDMT